MGLSTLLGTLLLAVPSYYATATSAESPEQAATSSADEKALRSQADDYEKAYARGDAKTVANMWTSDGTYTDADGVELKGRSDIEKYFCSGFKQFGAHPLDISVESIRFPASNVAIEKGSCRILSGPASGIKSRYTAVHVKEHGRWLVDAVTESEGPQETSSGSLKDLDWLIGSWTAKGPKGTMRFNADWAGDRKFIHCRYSFIHCTSSTNDSTSPKSEQMQIIGWNPMSKQITSWHFGSKGGFGYGRWLKDGQSFIETTNGLEPDGTASSSINTLHKLSDNSFTWSSTGRISGNDRLPDTPEISVTRDQ
jgi:uncharacterized protein (TIGR02246 family)